MGESAGKPDRIDALLLVLSVLLGVLLSMRWWDLSRWPVPVIQAGFPFLGLIAIGWLGVHLILRRWAAAVVAALVAAAPMSAAFATFDGSTVAARPDDQIVMAVNLEFGSADAEAVVEEVRARAASTLVLTEVTPEAQGRLIRAGLPRLLPYEVGTPGPAASGTVIRSRHPLTAVEPPQDSEAFDQPAARVHPRGGATYLVRGVHTFPPGRGLSQTWRDHLRGLTRWAQAQPEGEPLVLAGDFNASHAHPGFRAFTETFADAHRADGGGWVRTWPQGSTIPPFIALDHVLVRDASVVAAGTGAVPDTDHAAIWARLRIR